jgi:hypothetical protein
MTIEVSAPDGSVVEFPDTMDEASIDRAMRQHFSSAQTPAGRVAEDFASLPRQPFSLMDTREVPRPGAPGGNYSSDITQRARNTAFGQGPGSVAGIPGVALPLAVEGAGVVGGAVGRGLGALPDWAKTAAATGGLGLTAAAARQLGAPEAVVDWIKNFELARSFGKH